MNTMAGAATREQFDRMHPGLLEVVERAIAPYRPILPTSALVHFHRVAVFLVETHPAASRWFAELHPVARTREERDLPITTAFRAEYMDVIRELAGLPPPAGAPEEDEAAVLLHEAEAGLCFLVEARFPEQTTRDGCGAALDRFLALTFSALFAGLAGAIFRRAKEPPENKEVGRVVGHFLRTFTLMMRFDPRERDARTLDWYFVRRLSVAQIAEHTGNHEGAEKESVLAFLEVLGAFVVDHGPRLAADVEDATREYREANPWAVTLLGRGPPRGPAS